MRAEAVFLVAATVCMMGCVGFYGIHRLMLRRGLLPASIYSSAVAGGIWAVTFALVFALWWLCSP